MWPASHKFDMLDIEGQGVGRKRLRSNDKHYWERGVMMGTSAQHTKECMAGEGLCPEKMSIRTQTLIFHLLSLAR